MKKLFVSVYKFLKLLISLIGCIFGKHEWEYMWGNYHTGKDVFECKNCKRRIEE